jgi:hypothetical protein
LRDKGDYAVWIVANKEHFDRGGTLLTELTETIIIFQNALFSFGFIDGYEEDREILPFFSLARPSPLGQVRGNFPCYEEVPGCL